jgi:hypothetical protein
MQCNEVHMTYNEVHDQGDHILSVHYPVCKKKLTFEKENGKICII